LESNDAQTLLEYLKNKQIEDPVFFYAIQIDKPTGRITNFLCSDGHFIMDNKFLMYSQIQGIVFVCDIFILMSVNTSIRLFITTPSFKLILKVVFMKTHQRSVSKGSGMNW
jgi:hypothetical protein